MILTSQYIDSPIIEQGFSRFVEMAKDNSKLDGDLWNPDKKFDVNSLWDIKKENKDQIGIQSLIDKDGLYREEIYTDLNNGSIKALIPFNDLGVDVVDGSREPVYVAMMKSFKPTGRFKKFYSQLRNLGITRELENSIESWSYNK